jgi:hypothetical protein
MWILEPQPQEFELLGMKQSTMPRSEGLQDVFFIKWQQEASTTSWFKPSPQEKDKG